MNLFNKKFSTILAAWFVCAICSVFAIFCCIFMQPAQAQADDSSDIFNYSFDLFNSEYQNEEGDIVVKSDNSTPVIAPGISNEGTFSITNTSKQAMKTTLTFGSPFSGVIGTDFPLQIKLVDSEGNYVLGSTSSWAKLSDIQNVSMAENFAAGETKTFKLSWQWPFDSGNDAVDTKYGQMASSSSAAFQFDVNVQIKQEPIKDDSSSPSATSDASNETSSTSDFNLALIAFAILVLACSIYCACKTRNYTINNIRNGAK